MIGPIVQIVYNMAYSHSLTDCELFLIFKYGLSSLNLHTQF